MEYPATLVDLPTIIEAHKTLDYNTIFKCTDVAQMLFVHQPLSGISIAEFDPFKHGARFEHAVDPTFASMLCEAYGPNRYKCKTGITPPTCNVALARHKPKYGWMHDCS